MKKLNANPVGATIGCPHFEGIALKNNKGITLIALIITIIVMLILVGVTINVALNGGLFETAETAANSTTVEAEKEALSMAAIAAWDVGTGVDFDKMELPDGFTGLDGTYTSKESKKTYKVDKTTAKVTEYGEEVVDEDLAYVKAELETKTFLEIIDQAVSTESNIILKNKSITFAGFAYDGRPIVMYKGKKFIISIEGDGYLDYNSVIALVDYYIGDSKNYFNVQIEGTNAIIMGLTEYGAEDIQTNKELVIPATILGTNGFKYNVTEIGAQAFGDNADIEQLEFESGIRLEKIGESAFNNCISLKGEIILPNGLTKISYGTFWGCTNIENIEIPSTVVTIERGAFYSCSSITEITLPASIENLAQHIFSGWTEEQTIYIKGKAEEPVTTDNYSGVGWEHGWKYGCNANIVWDK